MDCLHPIQFRELLFHQHRRHAGAFKRQPCLQTGFERFAVLPQPRKGSVIPGQERRSPQQVEGSAGFLCQVAHHFGGDAA